MGSFGDEPSYETWDVGWPLTVEILPYHYKVIDCFFSSKYPIIYL